MKKIFLSKALGRKITTCCLVFCSVTFVAQTNPDNDVKSVSPTGNQKYSLNLYPNPSTGTVFFSGSDLNTRYVHGEVYNINGDLVLKQEILLENGKGNLKLDMENGVYTFYVYSDNHKTGIYILTINRQG